MRAVTVEPGVEGSVRYEEVPEPDTATGSVLVEALAVGICGTDVEIVEGDYGWAPRGQDAPGPRPRVARPGARPRPGSGFAEGRPRRRHRAPARPGAVPELRGGRVGHVPQRPLHRARHQADRRLHVRALADRARVRHARSTRRSASSGVLLEPTTVVAKAWEQIVASARAPFWEPQHGARHRRRADRPARRADRRCSAGSRFTSSTGSTSGPSRSWSATLGATYHTGAIADVGLRAGRRSSSAPASAAGHRRSHRVVAPGGDRVPHRASGPAAPSRRRAADVATEAVLKNTVLFGSVNANRRHYYKAAQALAAADRGWLAQLITRRVRPEDVQAGLARGSRTTSRSSWRWPSRERRRGRRGADDAGLLGQPRAAQRGTAVGRRAGRADLGRHPGRRGAHRLPSATTATSSGSAPSGQAGTSGRPPRPPAVATCWPRPAGSATWTTTVR